ncbi:FAD-linked oxidoreductase-like protein [Aspergillus avenaceus]|uniref:Proline dehydrogenase n=1 Tax=Aspergillus avenaceus TaxID=36643 RepID=A0A5N6TF84_ASPAV|nr:FAD-linked oxidoreductase-like protein [Aspergillus avenaceus]
MARLPIKWLLRSLFLTSIMRSKIILRPALAILNILSSTKSPLLNADKNGILKRLVRLAVYDQFCAGANHAEVSKTIAQVKGMGYQGVILGYSKEIMLDPKDHPSRGHLGSKKYSDRCYEMVEEWKEGTLRTLRMLDQGDFLAVKLTGAGPIAVDAMVAHEPMPDILAKAVDAICLETAKQGSRLWLDAEQQALQPGLDQWAMAMMRKHNRSEMPVVYNTIQAYLKGSKANVNEHIKRAALEGWSLGIKLVRGAYIEHEIRSLIHDTKEETDQSYNWIADTLLCRRVPDDLQRPFPHAALFLATHNAASTVKATATYQERLDTGLPTTYLECGQIQGMADELSCELLGKYESQLPSHKAAIPRIFKCLTWGSVAECMGYLHRRAIENRDAVERTQHMKVALQKELWRRIFRMKDRA